MINLRKWRRGNVMMKKIIFVVTNGYNEKFLLTVKNIAGI